MGKIKWTFRILVALVLIAFFHYSLPSRDVVQIVGTEVNRIDVDDNSWFWASKDVGTQTGTTTRDVRFINAQYENPLISLYPNAYKMKEVEGPNVRLIPWFNIIFLIVVFLIAFAIWRRVDRWKDKNVDPYLEDAGEFYDDVTDVLGDGADAARTRASDAKTGISKWLDTWKSKKR